jgi:argininosuccinate lyase
VIGALNALMIVMKGLPLTYSKDMQEDKEGAFDAIQSLSLCLAAMTGMVRDMEADEGKMRASAGAAFSTATDLADWLVRVLGLPFRKAHHVTGSIVKAASDAGCSLEELGLAAMQAIEPRITQEVMSVLGVEQSVNSRTSYGGTSPTNVAPRAQWWISSLRASDQPGG